MVDAHEEAHRHIEHNPCNEEHARAQWAQAGEKQGDAGDQEAGFLVREDGEDHGAGEGGHGALVAQINGDAGAGADEWGQRQRDECRPKELREVREKVLVVRV